MGIVPEWSGLGLTTNVQLIDLAKRMNLPQIQYVGFADDLKELSNGFSVINLGSKHLGGTHWTLLWVEPNQIIYADSYGVGPEDNIIRLAREQQAIYWNTKQVQGYSEEFCGIWALCFANAMNGQKNKIEALDRFIDKFESVV